MKSFLIKGGKPLKGSITISGSKNAALPIMAACLLTDETCVLKNVPDIADVHSMANILRALGAKITFNKGEMTIRAASIKTKKIPHELVAQLRASILLLGPLVARFKNADLAFPGGCILGKRSVHAHTEAFKKLGCKVKNGCEIKLVAKELHGADITMFEISVTATENIVMAACLAKGKTRIRLAAAEPHVQDLCKFLNKMGAKIKGIGTHFLEIQGVQKLKGISHTIISDYLETGTFALAAVITNGDVTLKNAYTHELDSFWNLLSEAGAKFELGEDTVKIKGNQKLRAVEKLRTAVYPSFPTDLQAPFTVLLTQAKGVSKIFETLFEGRLTYLVELEKMGARVEILNPNQAIVIGPTKLKGVPVSSCDIRAGAAIVIAALAAKGETMVNDIQYIDRGYEDFDKKLKELGADIERIESST